jgi:glucosamine-6-phosphate deaminase
MKFIVVKNYDEMSFEAAKRLIEQVKRKPSSVLGLATGSTPIGTYKLLVKDHKEKQTSYQNVRTINLDEYVGLSGDNKNSFRYFMDHHLFNETDIDKANTFIPNGQAKDLTEECRRYDQLVQDYVVDLQLLGIGENGHIGFNEPGTSFYSKTHVVELTESTRQANAKDFNRLEEVPTHAITMGIKSILQSKEIILLASGKNKADAMKMLVSGKIDEQFPASALHLHDNVTIIADHDALMYCGDVINEVQHV